MPTDKLPTVEEPELYLAALGLFGGGPDPAMVYVPKHLVERQRQRDAAIAARERERCAAHIEGRFRSAAGKIAAMALRALPPLGEGEE